MVKQMAENDYKTSSSVIYPLPPSIASDSEFATGTSTTASPTVKQCKEKLVTIDTVQTISGSKRFTTPAEGMSIELTADTNQQTVPAEATLRQLGLYRNATYTKGDGFTSWLQAIRGSDGWTGTELYTRRLLEGDSQEIINYIRVNVTPEGVPTSYTRTPPVGVAGEEIVTAGWFRLPACSVKTVIETYHKGTDWYRIYSDGWCEQGGVVSSPATDSSKSVSLLKVFTDTNYSLMVTENGTTINTQESGSLTCLKRVSSFQLYNNGYGYSGHTVNWFACGY